MAETLIDKKLDRFHRRYERMLASGKRNWIPLEPK